MTESSSDHARRRALLHEMGLGPTWVHRGGADAIPHARALPAEANENLRAMTASEVAKIAVISTATTVTTASSAVHVTTSDLRKGQPPALSAWELEPQQVTDTMPAIAPTDTEIAAMNWPALQATVAACVRCPLCKTRRRTVFGFGDQRARWLLVGEGPGRSEDQQGEPFVGPAGKLLDNMLQEVDLKRGENTYIANIVKCRPTDASGNDRAPTAEEAAACRPYLDRQISLLQPATILALGKVAAVSLLGCDPKTAVSALRGLVHRHGSAALVVTYHPAYLLRKPLDKAKSWQDLCMVRQSADAPSPLRD